MRGRSRPGGVTGPAVTVVRGLGVGGRAAREGRAGDHSRAVVFGELEDPSGWCTRTPSSLCRTGWCTRTPSSLCRIAIERVERFDEEKHALASVLRGAVATTDIASSSHSQGGELVVRVVCRCCQTRCRRALTERDRRSRRHSSVPHGGIRRSGLLPRLWGFPGALWLRTGPRCARRARRRECL